MLFQFNTHILLCNPILQQQHALVQPNTQVQDPQTTTSSAQNTIIHNNNNNKTTMTSSTSLKDDALLMPLPAALATCVLTPILSQYRAISAACIRYCSWLL